MSNEIIQGYRLSPQQERLWALQQMGSRMPYQASCAISIEGQLDPSHLKAALEEVVNRHEILRTTFHRLSAMTMPVQVIAPVIPLALPEHDLRETDSSAQEAALDRLLHDIAGQEPDLEKGPLFNLLLIRLSAESNVLMIHLPAMCSDRVGLSNLMSEIGNAYAARLRGVELSGEPLQYADLAEWQNELLESEDTRGGREYWRQNRFQTSPVIELPFKEQSSGATDFAPQTVGSRIGSVSVPAITALARQYGTTMRSFLLTCWQVLLWRLSGQQPDCIVAVAYEGRKYEELGSALGPLTRYLPVHAHLEAGLPFSTLLKQMNQSVLDADKWQEYFTWEEITAADSIDNRPGYFPFAFEFAEEPPILSAGGIRLSMMRQRLLSERFQVKLDCLERGESLSAELQYDEALYRRVEMSRLIGRFEHLLLSALNHPEMAVDRLEILGDAERHQLLFHWNETAVEYPREKCLHHLVEEQVERTPEAVALIYQDQSLTYRELNEQANQLAHYLRALGVGPEVKVGLYIERSMEMMVGLLGILKAGGSYVPLDPEYPQERLRFMLEDARVAVMVTIGRLVAGMPSHAAPLVCLDADRKRIELESKRNPLTDVDSRNTAYVIYTSGSTGQPKGVMVEHRAINNRLVWMQREYPLTAADRLLQKTPISFDASIWELFVPLLSGAQLVIARPGGHQDSHYLATITREQEVTVLQLIPSMLQAVLEESAFEQCRSLRRMYCGGEAFPADLQRRFEDRLGAELHNLYGPTEASIDAAHWLCERGSERRVVPIGKPLANMQLYILDQHGQPVPTGIAGELHIGGVGLARGYLDRPELTAERFIPHQFSKVGGERLYRTGDLARFLNGGEIEFLGRSDQQVKLRGFRIELGEIETLLNRHPAVREAVVLARESSSGEKCLVAYLVPRENVARAAPGEHLYRLPNNLEIAYLNKGETDVIYQEVFEDEVYLKHGVTLNDGACVFDVGANIGLFTLFVHQKCRDARVYAFEPLPPIFKVLRANITQYRLNTKLFECGLADKSGIAFLTFYPKASTLSGLYANAEEDEQVMRAFLSNQDEVLAQYADELLAGRLKGERLECRLRTLSEVIAEQEIERIDLLKIDVEKSELDVLNGIEQNDWPKIRQMVVEVHDIEGRLDQIISLLESRGYKLEVEQDLSLKATGLYNIYALHHSLTPNTNTNASGNGKKSDHGLTLPEHRPSLGDELRGYLKENLPEYMVPSAFVMLDHMPLAPNGKLDRRALPDPDESRDQAATGSQLPRTPVEEVLATVWAEVLGVARVGIHDNFFELGGHSLLATRLMSRVRQCFAVEVALHILFETPTVAGLAVIIERELRAGQGVEEPPIRPVSRERELPLSFAQQRLWFLDQLEPGSAFYNIATAVRLQGQLDYAALEQCINEVVNRHESLRTTFMSFDGQPSQLISPSLCLKLSFTDLSDLPDARREAEARRLIAEETARPFDLAHGPLLRTILLRMGREEHLAVLTMHHIVSDGWSRGVLIRELAALYEAFSSGAPSPLPELSIQYADYAVWQREWLKGEVLERQLEYWRERLAGSPVLELPTDRPRPPLQSFKGAMHPFMLSEELSGRLKALARQESATFFMLLLAAFQALLWRYSGQEDIVVGTPIANRTRIETEALIGFFVNMQALRLRVTGELSFLELVSRAREATLTAYAHQDVPFEKLVEELQPERDLSRHPLFQVMFTLQPPMQERLEIAGLQLRGEAAESRTAKFDLTLLMEETEAGTAAAFEYNTDLFDAATIERLTKRFMDMLEGIVESPAQSISQLLTLNADERQQILVEWNQTQADYPREQCIHELFEEQAARTPHALALLHEHHQVSYAQLNHRANRLARRLRRLGVGPESRVAILLDRSPGMVVALLGVLKAGGAYVPLDAQYPPERLSFMLEQAQATALVTRRHLLGLVPEGGARRVCLEAEAEWEAEAEGNPESGVAAENVAYVIYTSGSSGTPKGVQVSHGALVNFLCSMRERPGLNENDVLLSVTSLSFDISALEIYLPLITGARVEIVSREVASDALMLRRYLQQCGATIMQATPTTWRMLIEADWQGRDGLKVLCGGESLPSRLAGQLIERSDEVWNMYGPTETTVWSTLSRLEAGLGTVPIGRPIANTQVYIVDRSGEPVPVGVKGELCIGGEGVARGYLGLAEATAEKFTPDPFSAQPGARLYRTGDLARYLPSGQIEYLGRLDQQVKVHGYRIEPGEIEAALERHESIREAVVAAHLDGDERYLVGYLVLNSEKVPGAGELRDYLREKLPEYMVPSAFVILKELPLTPNGKVNRKALPAPERSTTSRRDTLVPPRTVIEEMLVGIWDEILPVGTFGVTDNFFDLGGHSLLATQLLSRLRHTFQIELPLRLLFQSATIETLAQLLVAHEAKPGQTEKIALVMKKIKGMSADDVTDILKTKKQARGDV